MQLFYYPNLSLGAFSFNEEESKHCIKVLRNKTGDTLQLIDGKGRLAQAIITKDHPKKCEGEITQVTLFEPNRSYQLALSIAPTKQHERIDWLVEKACEIGIDEINFIACENSERERINIDRLQKICISAIKQSKQYYLPALGELKPLRDHLKTASDWQKYIAWCETNPTEHLAQQLNQSEKKIHLLIGPEGDFSAKEISLSQEAGYQPISLGSNILRTETAAITAVATVAAVLSKSL